MPLLGVERRAEVKCRGNGFRDLYRWLGTNDFLIIRADRKGPLVVIPMRLASEVAAAAEGLDTRETPKTHSSAFLSHHPIGEG
jgi:hypothetical protein